MKRGNRNRYRLCTGATASRRLYQSLPPESEGKVRIERINLHKGHIVAKNGGVGVIYVGPSVEGGDKEYVKVLTGDVDRRKPSFA